LAARGAAPASAPKQQEKVDLDIALNNMMGQEFARWISRYNKHHNLPTSKIGAAPERSGVRRVRARSD
jgi:hypothetical protein